MAPELPIHLRERLATSFCAEMRDPRVGMVSVNEVRVSRDSRTRTSSCRRSGDDSRSREQGTHRRAEPCGRVLPLGARARQHDAHHSEAALPLRRLIVERARNSRPDRAGGRSEAERAPFAESRGGSADRATEDAHDNAGADVISGMLVLDKPQRHDVQRRVAAGRNGSVPAQKVGHTGSLDPLATGVLPFCFGEATKFSQFLLDSDKKYWARDQARRYDRHRRRRRSGARDPPVGRLWTRRRIEEVLARFRGEIEQVPSMFSAIKHQGQPLYKLARRGIEVERKRVASRSTVTSS